MVRGRQLNLSVSCTVQLVDTTVEIANKVGAAEITSRVVEDLKDENEPYRKMVMDCIEKVCNGMGNGIISSMPYNRKK